MLIPQQPFRNDPSVRIIPQGNFHNVDCGLWVSIKLITKINPLHILLQQYFRKYGLRIVKRMFNVNIHLSTILLLQCGLQIAEPIFNVNIHLSAIVLPQCGLQITDCGTTLFDL